MRIAVTGASGQLGQLIISQLFERTEAKNIVALVRNPEKASELSSKGSKSVLLIMDMMQINFQLNWQVSIGFY